MRIVILRSAISKKSVKDPRRFVFPVEPDLASVAETDIAIVLAQPLIAGQTTRLKSYPSFWR
jgi:hypothetical protein